MKTVKTARIVCATLLDSQARDIFIAARYLTSIGPVCDIAANRPAHEWIVEQLRVTGAHSQLIGPVAADNFRYSVLPPKTALAYANDGDNYAHRFVSTHFARDWI